MIIFVCLLSLVLAQIFVRPLRRLKTAAQRIAAGEEGVQVDAGSSDELADVATAFNDMSRSLAGQVAPHRGAGAGERAAHPLVHARGHGQPLQARRRRDHPGQRRRHGDLRRHRRVRGARAVDDVRRGDRPAQRPRPHASTRPPSATASSACAPPGRATSPAAASATPRVDNARRAVEFALELETILERYSTQQGVELGLRAGLDSGKVTSGLIGRARVVYDMWGDAVNLAFRVQGDSDRARHLHHPARRRPAPGLGVGAAGRRGRDAERHPARLEGRGPASPSWRGRHAAWPTSSRSRGSGRRSSSRSACRSLLIGLTEFHNSLARRGSRAAPIVLMVRNYLVPVAGDPRAHHPARRVAGSGHVAAGHLRRSSACS